MKEIEVSRPEHGWLTETIPDDLKTTVDGIEYVRYDAYLTVIRQRNEARADFIQSAKGGVLSLRLDEARNEVARLSKLLERTPAEFAVLHRQLEEERAKATGWKNRFETCWEQLEAAEVRIDQLKGRVALPRVTQ